MGSGYSKKKKQAKLLQQQFAEMQEQMKNTQKTGEAGNGLVKITLNGENEMEKIEINPDCVDPEDVEGLEDLIKSAYNNASEQLKENAMPNMPDMPDMSSFF